MTSGPQNRSDANRDTRRRLWIALLLAIVAATLALTTDLRILLAQCLEWIRGLGPTGVAAYSVVYVVTVVLLIPATFMTLGAGATFGVPLGFPLAWLSATAGATLSFVLGRTLVRGWVEQRLVTHPRLAALDQAVAQSGWKIVALSRLCPFFPFPLLNYAYGGSRITLTQYVPATALGLVPGVFLYVWIGDALGDMAGLDVGQALGGPWQWIFYISGIVIAILVGAYVTRLAQRALHEQTDLHTPPPPSSQDGCPPSKT